MNRHLPRHYHIPSHCFQVKGIHIIQQSPVPIFSAKNYQSRTNQCNRMPPTGYLKYTQEITNQISINKSAFCLLVEYITTSKHIIEENMNSMNKPRTDIYKKNKPLIKSVTGAFPEVSIKPQACVSRSMNLTARNQWQRKRFFSIYICEHRQLI